MKTRQDSGLPFLLRYENIAWYEEGVVRILDRRVYPWKQEFVICTSHLEVAAAIRDMVTQSGGPALAAAMGMALAAREAKKHKDPLSFLLEAGQNLAGARPTTARRQAAVVQQSLEAAERHLQAGGRPEELAAVLKQEAVRQADARYARIERMASHLVALFPQKGCVMTYCFAETIVGKMLLACRREKKQIRFLCPETRPYLQGARLTASVISDLGFDVQVIGDGMAASLLKREAVDLFTTAADVITLDGHVVNKAGTFPIALAARYWDIPYYACGTPNENHPTLHSVLLEEREGRELVEWQGRRLVKEAVGALYPAFDVTPPSLVTGVVTAGGVLPPDQLARTAVADRRSTNPQEPEGESCP